MIERRGSPCGFCTLVACGPLKLFTCVAPELPLGERALITTHPWVFDASAILCDATAAVHGHRRLTRVHVSARGALGWGWVLSFTHQLVSWWVKGASQRGSERFAVATESSVLGFLRPTKDHT